MKTLTHCTTKPTNMGSKLKAIFFACMLSTLITLPPAYSWQQNCPPSYPPYHRPTPPSIPHPRPPSKPHPHPPSPPKHHPPSPPHHGGKPPITKPPVVVPPIFMPPPIVNPPIILPPITNPPVILPPPSSPYPPYTPPGGGGPPGVIPPPGGGGGAPPAAKCPIDALKLGLCLDVLGGLVHVGIGNPIENICCPVIQGLLELEAAICLCTTIRLKLLNLNIFIPLALQVLATCGFNPPPGFTCPPLK